MKLVDGKRVPETLEDLAQAALDKAKFEEEAPKRALAMVIEKRKAEYLTIGEQLDMIFHQGLNAWKAHIAKVKTDNPKPSQE